MTNDTCSIPEHEWLTLELDDWLDDIDPMGIVCDRVRPHEYLPEIPDFIRMIVTDTISTQGVEDVWTRYFGHPLGPYASVTTENLVNGLHHYRREWLALLDRISNPDRDQGPDVN